MVDRPAFVVIDDPPTMNLLGLLLGNLMSRQAQLPGNARRLTKLKGDLVVEAGRMTITLAFGSGQVTIRRGTSERPRAWVKGSLEALLQVSLGGGMVRPWLRGDLRTRGSIPLLLRSLPLFRAA
jgi:hypothetical protein